MFIFGDNFLRDLLHGVYTQYFLHKVQLHVSALDNGHLQVVHEILIEQL